MAQVRPLAIIIARKVVLSSRRPGSPNETLLAPEVVLRPSFSVIHLVTVMVHHAAE